MTNIGQNIGTKEREALLKTLEFVRDAIKTASELTDDDRRELVEVAEEAPAEVTKERTNTRR